MMKLQMMLFMEPQVRVACRLSYTTSSSCCWCWHVPGMRHPGGCRGGEVSSAEIQSGDAASVMYGAGVEKSSVQRG